MNLAAFVVHVHIETIETGVLVSKQECYGGNKFHNFDLTLQFFFSRKVASVLIQRYWQ